MFHSNTLAFCQRLTRRASAWAALRGVGGYGELLGTVKLFGTAAGTLALLEIWGLPNQTPWTLTLAPRGRGNTLRLRGEGTGPGFAWAACFCGGTEVRPFLGGQAVLCLGGEAAAQGEIG